MCPLASAKTDSVWPMAARSSPLSRTAHGSTANRCSSIIARLRCSPLLLPDSLDRHRIRCRICSDSSVLAGVGSWHDLRRAGWSVHDRWFIFRLEQDRPGAAGGEVAPCPVDEYLQAIPEADQVEDVDAEPEQPCQ